MKRRVFAASFPWSYVVGELWELAEALKHADLVGIREEWSDVCLCFLAWASEYIPIDWMPVLPGLGLLSAKKFFTRRKVWRAIFSIHERDFENVFLTEGGNFKRRHKVLKALTQAGVAEGDIQWPAISKLVGGFED